MLHLSNGCRCSEPSVFPSNWKTGGMSLLKKQWYLQYKFYDPQNLLKYPTGKVCIVKGGLNRIKDIDGRRKAVPAMLLNLMDLLKNWQWNPITAYKVPPIIIGTEFSIACEIDPITPFFDSLKQVLERLDVSRETKADMKSVLKYTEITGIRLGYHALKISEVRRKHIKILLDQVGKIDFTNKKGKAFRINYTNNRYNVYRKYLHRLFEELIEMEATELNPVSRIAKKKTIKRMRKTLTLEERKKVDKYLKEKNYTFWRFCHIFFHSGARMAELMKVKRSAVDLKAQKFNYFVKKGQEYIEVTGTIKDNILPLWCELLEESKMSDFIFGEHLKPGPASINSHQITRRWRTQIKEKLGITADIYSLKHSNLDETAGILSIADASKMAKHTSQNTTLTYYLAGEGERQHLRLKTVNNEF